MALLVLLPAAARTRIVASDLGFFAFDGLDRRIVTTDARRLARRHRAGRKALSDDASRSPRARARERRGRLGRIVEEHRLPSLGRNGRRGPARPDVAAARTPSPFSVMTGRSDHEIADDLLVDALLHRLKELEAFFLVLDQRIALTVAAQADAFLQMVEAVEMIFPLHVDDLQHDVALDPLEHLATDELFLLGVQTR